MPEEPNAQLDIYVGKDDLEQYRLYTSENATVPLPSHVLTLNSGVVCEVNFWVKTTQPQETFDSSRYLQWTASPPASLISQARVSSTQVTLLFNTDTETELIHEFNLFMTGDTSPVPIFCENNGVPVDPTVVEKPPEPPGG